MATIQKRESRIFSQVAFKLKLSRDGIAIMSQLQRSSVWKQSFDVQDGSFVADQSQFEQ